MHSTRLKPRAMQSNVEAPATTITPSATEVLLGKYQLGRLLGRGSFAKVYHARSLADGTGVAIKVIDKSLVTNTTKEGRIVREVLAMRRLQHPNVIRIHEVMATKTKIYLVMEYARGGELFDKISRDGRLSESDARRCFQQLVSALHFCHKNGIAHRDIKPQNLLLDHEGNLKVSDFGLSALPEQLKDGLLQTACGTPAYTAPEVVGRTAYDGAKADAWSCGVILFLLLAGYLPFDHSNLIVMYRKIISREYLFPSWFSKPVREVITQLLDPRPETRIGIEALMEDHWFKKSFEYNSTPSQPEVLLQKDFKSDLIAGAPTMNAFDIISLSSGLDLSGLFEARKKKEKRFTTTMTVEKTVERVMEIGAKSGYDVRRRKDGIFSMEKGIFFLQVEVLKMAPKFVVVEVNVINEGLDFEELHWEDLRADLDDLALAWHDNGS